MTKEELIVKFNELNIEDMAEVSELHELKGDFINLEYILPSGQTAQLWEYDKTYYGAEICKEGSKLCYGLADDEKYLLVCEYGEGGTDAEIVIFKRI